jgi:predicted O-methyltransferase YrrM
MIDIDLIQTFITEIDDGLSIDLPAINGYSSDKVRKLLTLLVGQFANHYLEIGVHMGSTFIPAIFGNDKPATCIDNWSRFGNLRPQFESNLAQYGLLTDRIQIIEQDCWTVNLDTIEAHGGKVDVYFYDGDHEPQNDNPQFKAVDYYLPILADRFILLVDDANYPGVVQPTMQALEKNKVKIVKDWFLPGPYDGGPNDWWNGLLVIVGDK